MRGSTTSPHCTQRFAANSNSPVLFIKSMQKSLTMSPPHLLHVDSRWMTEETLEFPGCSTLFFPAIALAMIASISFMFNVCSKYV